MGTANTMQVLSEILGISMPFSSTKIAGTAAQLRLAKEAGGRIVELVRKHTCFSNLVTRQSMKNMVHGAMALGAASNSILHRLALSYEMGYEDVINIDYIAQASHEIPCILNVKPVGNYYLTDFERLGGVPLLLSRIRGFLNGGCMTVSGMTISQICKLGAELDTSQMQNGVMGDLKHPVMENGGIIVLRGNLADSAIVRAFKHSRHTFNGKAKVYESQEEAVDAVKQGRVEAGDVIVLRYMGPKGGPGMPDCFGVAAAVVGAGLEESVAVITDGRFSGFARGIGVCQICPEAASGGPLAKVCNGDEIIINALEGKILDAAPGFNQRPISPAPERCKRGILNIYRRIAGEASTGARL